MYIPTRVRQSGDARYPKIKDVAFIIITVIVASQFTVLVNLNTLILSVCQK